MITFGGKVLVVEEFSTVDQISCTAFVPKGNTPMGEAIEHAVALLTERKNMYKASGLPYYRPWIFLVTDGEPTDDWQTAATLVHEQEAGKHLLFFAVGVGHANMSVLKQISVRQPRPPQRTRVCRHV
ncbi:MAG: VWA domain-containing protein [Caldilineaceae bacterium]